MVVESLRHQVERQGVLPAGGLLDLGTLVLKPDLDLGLFEAEVPGQTLPPLLREVPVALELLLQPLQLLRGEGGAGPLVLFARSGGCLWFAGSGPCG